MSREKKLVPELRFAEFEGDGYWVVKNLGKVYSFLATNSFSRDKLNYQNGEVKNIHYGDIHTKFSTLFDITKEIVPFVNPDVSIERIKEESYCLEGDMIFADASEDLNDIGKSIEVVNINNEKLLSGLHTLMARQINKEVEIGFGGYLFKSGWIRKQIQREAQGSKVLGISVGRILGIKIAFPNNTMEQQKIASCLSSLDDLIAAHKAKLDALKDHKKGLMQNLFPQEGETVPRVRFAEFVGDGEWVENKLGANVDFIMGNAFKSQDFVEDGVQLIRMGNLYQGKLQLNRMPVFLPKSFETEYSLFLVRPKDLLMSMTGTMGKKDYGFVIEIPEQSSVFLLNQRVLKIIPKKTCLKGFVLQLLKNDAFLDILYSIPGGTKQANLSTKDLKEIKFYFPPIPEQQKIASCLSSLDELITAQSEKLAQLQQHKQGLMQGLFPKIEN